MINLVLQSAVYIQVQLENKRLGLANRRVNLRDCNFSRMTVWRYQVDTERS